MPTIKEFARKVKRDPVTVQRWIKELNKAPENDFLFGVNEDIDPALLSLLNARVKGKRGKPKVVNGRELTKPPKQVEAKKKSGFSWVKFVAALPVPMLGLAASHGVYYFARNFAPEFVAIGEAAGFEFVYIGLALLKKKKLTDAEKKTARFVAIAAVIVSALYNSIAGAIYYNSELIENLSGGVVWLVSIVHGLPLPILTYYVINLLIHESE